MKRISYLALGAAFLLGACSSVSKLLDTDSAGIDYKSSKSAAKLEVPPDLTQLSAAGRLSGSRSAISASAPLAAVSNVLPQNTRVRMERNGAQRYLVVDLPAEQVYPVLTSFWKDQGFTLAIDSPQTGIIETDWAENRAKLPASGLRSLMGGFMEKIFDSGLRDKFRTRIDRLGNSTEVYISHRGSKEAAVDNRAGAEVKVSARDNDVELENDFLRRLMLRFGASESTATNAVNSPAAAMQAAAPQVARARVVGADSIQLDDNFDSAYRRVGAALDRAGFTIDDRNVSTGEYFVRYARNRGDADAGIFAKLFGGSRDALSGARKLKVAVSRSGSATVKVTDDKGAAAEADLTKTVVSVLVEELK